MKTTLLISMFLLGVMPASAMLTSNIKYSQRGDSVTELQEFLSEKGFLNVSPTGFFGLKTLSAVKAYQTSKGLPSTGFVGQMTRGEINKDLQEELAVSDEAEIAETGTTTPVTVATTTIIYVPQYVQAPVSTGNVSEQVYVAPVVTPVAKEIRFESFYRPKQDDFYTVYVRAYIFGGGHLWADEPVTFTSPDLVSVSGQSNMMADLRFSTTGEKQVTVEIPSLGLTKTFTVTVN
jgi:peptidoglycan hydrolase-like protein with peptidoglycan-binding domain